MIARFANDPVLVWLFLPRKEIKPHWVNQSTMIARRSERT